MPLITWSNKLSTGISEQDRQHKQLICLINDLNEAMQAGKGATVLGALLAELIRYTEYHFSYEEELMARHSHADLHGHSEEHARLAETARKFKKRFDEGRLVISFEIMDLLRKWFFSHTLKSDMSVAHALVKAGVR